jgi:hypothetical protein
VLERGVLTDKALRTLAAAGLLHALDCAENADGGRPDGPADVRSLDLNSAPLTDAGVEELWALTGLRRLDLSRTGVSDAGLKTLSAFKELRELDLRRTRTTDAGVKELRAALPKCAITH